MTVTCRASHCSGHSIAGLVAGLIAGLVHSTTHIFWPALGKVFLEPASHSSSQLEVADLVWVVP